MTTPEAVAVVMLGTFLMGLACLIGLAGVGLILHVIGWKP